MQPFCSRAGPLGQCPWRRDAATAAGLSRSLVGLGQFQGWESPRFPEHTGASQGLVPNPSPGLELGLSTERGLYTDCVKKINYIHRIIPKYDFTNVKNTIRKVIKGL